MKNCFVWLLVVLSSAPFVTADEIDVKVIQKEIVLKQANWIAKENKITRLSAEQRRRLCGSIVDPFETSEGQILSLPRIEILPDSLDWRNYGGNWVTPVRDQADCGSCWAFSALAQVESWWKIYNTKPDTNLDLSEQFLLSCSDAGNCEQGGYVFKSLDFVQSNGIPLESCLPYKAKSNIPCSNACPDWKERSVTIPGWGFITMDESQVENIKTALYYHPVSASYEVFSDFYAYHRGVYEHVFGDSEGWHAILIVGWNDSEQSWICKNSWGKDWGDNGYFRIKWNNSNLGYRCPYIWETSSSSLFVLQNNIDFSLTYGDSDSAEFELGNFGNESTLYFVSEEWDDEDEVDWLDVKNSGGLLQSGEKTVVKLYANTKELEPGFYRRYLTVTSNDISNPLIQVRCNLNVTRPEYDIRINEFNFSRSGFKLLNQGEIGLVIENIGAQTFDMINLECTISQKEIVYSDTVQIKNFASQKRQKVQFKPYKAYNTGQLLFTAKILDASQDYNAFNNICFDSVIVSNLIEGFEEKTENWIAKDGWSFGDKLNGHSGTCSAHVYGGVYPYLDNMNTIMIHRPGIELESIDTLYVSYWIRGVTADSLDICYFEVSNDSMNWDIFDSVTGTMPAWKKRIINLSEFIKKYPEKIWFRYRFISNESGTSIGLLVDDIELFTQAIKIDTTTNPGTLIMEQQDSHKLSDWQLGQNYPNPFNPVTTIQYSVAEAAYVKLKILNLQGQLVEELFDDFLQPGLYKQSWNGLDFASGVYFYMFEARSLKGEFITKRNKMLLVK